MAQVRTNRVVRIVAWSLGAVLLVFALLATGATIALARGWLTPFLERQASAALGMPVRIEGGASLLWEWPPAIRIDGLALGEDGKVARVGRLEVAVRPLPLVTGDAVIARLDASRARIDRAALSAARTEGAPRDAEPAPQREASAPPRIERLSLQDIVYFDPEPGFGGPLSLELDRAEGSFGEPAETSLEAQGRLRRDPGEVRGIPRPPLPPDADPASAATGIESGFDLPISVQVSPESDAQTRGTLRLGEADRLDFAVLQDGSRIRSASLQGQGSVLGQVVGSLGFLGRPVGDWSLDARLERSEPGAAARLALQAEIDGTRIRFDGEGDEAAPLRRFAGNAELEGDDPADLLETLGRTPVSLPPYRVTARIERREGAVRVLDLAGKIGDSDIGGELSFDLAAEPVASRGTLRSQRLDLDDLGPLIGLPPGSAESETISARQREQARVYAANPRVLPDLPFRSELWQRLDIDLRYEAAEIEAPGLPLASLGFTVRVADGTLSVEPLEAGLADGRMTLRARIDGAAQPPNARFEVTGDRLQIASFLRAADAGPLALGALRVRVNLEGAGAGLREVLDSSAGRVALSLTGGAVQHRLVELAGLDIGEFLALALGDDERRIPIRCVVADLAVERGTARTRALLFDTPDSKVVGQGSLDLGSETMRVMFRVYPRDFSLLAANMPIRVTGTLKSPTVEPAGFGAEDSTLGWLLAPVDAVLAFIAPGYEDDHPCAQALGAAARVAAPAEGLRTPSQPGPPSGSPQQR